MSFFAVGSLGSGLMIVGLSFMVTDFCPGCEEGLSFMVLDFCPGCEEKL